MIAWRWTPFIALSGGALCFATFAMLVIPDHIGGASAPSSGVGFSSSFSQTAAATPGPFGAQNSEAAEPAPPSPPPAAAVVARAPADFPRRGFSPPLERPEQPQPAPPPPTYVPPPPQPVLDPPPPPPQQPPSSVYQPQQGQPAEPTPAPPPQPDSTAQPTP